VTTVDDEQNLTNYLILVGYVIGLNQSWKNDKGFFIRNGGNVEPFFGTQLVLLSRALDVVSQSVQDSYFAMDSVFLGDSERQTTQLDFAGLSVMIPDPKTKAAISYLFPPDTSCLFVAELLDWIDRAASEELPRLLNDAGKDGLASLKSVVDQLRKFARGAIAPPQKAPGLPPGYHTPRVKRALELLADGLDETFRLASPIQPPDLSLEVSPDVIKDIRQELQMLQSQVLSAVGTPPVMREEDVANALDVFRRISSPDLFKRLSDAQKKQFVNLTYGLQE